MAFFMAFFYPHLLDDLKPEAGQTLEPLGVVGEYAEPAQPQVAQNLAADADFALIHRLHPRDDAVVAREVGHVDVVAGRTPDLLQPATLVVADALRAHVDQRAAPNVADHLQGRAEALERPLRVLDGALADRPHLLGDAFTIADLNVASVLSLANIVSFDLAGFPNVKRWFDSCLSRPAFARVLQS